MMNHVCLLLILGGILVRSSTSFTTTTSLVPKLTDPQKIFVSVSSRSRTSLFGYLDNLSPPQPDRSEDEENENNAKSSQPPASQRKQRTGGVPSGRGPNASYLDIMTGAASADEEDDDEEEDTEMEGPSTTEKPAGWSGGYLSEFLLDDQDDSRTDVRNLLTQRSIQSFMCLLEKCRDPHSAKWIQEDFLQTGNLLDFHGTGAKFIEQFGGSWDGALLSMVQQPPFQMIISAKRRGRGHGGWSKNNPYLKERWMEMPIDIDPSNLASRILLVREQIAEEWSLDLEVVKQANNQILESYFAKVRANKDVGDGSPAFDRTAVDMMNDNSRFGTIQASSPFRRSNFDLLYNLCTQASIHRLLRLLKSNNQEHTSEFTFLRDFYTDRASEYFDGVLPLGCADDFMEELLQTAPFYKQGGGGGLVDPLGAAEEIIRMRNIVAEEWQEAMRGVPQEHTIVRQALLTKQMQSWDGQSGGHDVDSDNAVFQ